MSTPTSVSKKRKRDPVSDGIVFQVAHGLLGPLLVSHPALEAPASTAFKCYANKKTKTDSQRHDRDEEDIIVAGETDAMEFVSHEVESKRLNNSGCRYLIAIHNKRTSTLNVLPAAKIPYIMTRTVKASKNLPSSKHVQQEFKEARAALGEVFGTKKAKANIRAEERNKVDVGAMKNVIDHIRQGIDKATAVLLTTEEAKEEADKNRLIPPFDSSTKNPEDVYPLHQIIPQVEWKALSISAFDQASSSNERNALLPFKGSKWINQHFDPNDRGAESEKTRKRNLKILLYISSMMAFHNHMQRKRNVKSEELTDKMPGVPSIVVDGLLSRFSEIIRGSTNHVLTPATRTKLMTYMFALCLKVDNFACNTTQLAYDLSKTVTDVNSLFRSLGCKISILGQRERSSLGVPDSEATIKRAVLVAPVVFPKSRIRRK